MDDDQPGQEVTRVPTQNDLVKIAREFNRLGVAYVVIGGFAINRLPENEAELAGKRL